MSILLSYLQLRNHAVLQWDKRQGALASTHDLTPHRLFTSRVLCFCRIRRLSGFRKAHPALSQSWWPAVPTLGPSS